LKIRILKRCVGDVFAPEDNSADVMLDVDRTSSAFLS